MPTRAELEGVLAFLRGAEALKHQTRTAWASTGRRESVAEHTWRLALLALVVAPHLPGVDAGRLLKLCVVHDLGEALGGDVPAVAQGADGGAKAAREREDLARLTEPLPAAARAEVRALWEEYEAAATPEARLAKGLDKLETVLQHTQGANPPGFDYAFNLAYGRRHTDAHPLVAALRALVDADTAARAGGAGGGAGRATA